MAYLCSKLAGYKNILLQVSWHIYAPIPIMPVSLSAHPKGMCLRRVWYRFPSLTSWRTCTLANLLCFHVQCSQVLDTEDWAFQILCYFFDGYDTYILLVIMVADRVNAFMALQSPEQLNQCAVDRSITESCVTMPQKLEMQYLRKQENRWLPISWE
jgi:hypothetical protein